MNKEISLKAFLLFLVIFLLILGIGMYIFLDKDKKIRVNDNPCSFATCVMCKDKGNQEVCSDCNIFNEKNERVWTGTCIFKKSVNS